MDLCCQAYTHAEIHLKWGINKANNSVKQVLDIASQNKFTPREKYNVEEQETAWQVRRQEQSH